MAKKWYQEKMVRSGHGYRTSKSGPYLYEYWREGGKLRCKYLGKVSKEEHLAKLAAAKIRSATEEASYRGRGLFVIDGENNGEPLGADHDGLPLRRMRLLHELGLDPLLPQNRETVRKRLFTRLNRKGITDTVRAEWQLAFALLCMERGWVLPQQLRNVDLSSIK